MGAMINDKTGDYKTNIKNIIVPTDIKEQYIHFILLSNIVVGVR